MAENTEEIVIDEEIEKEEVEEKEEKVEEVPVRKNVVNAQRRIIEKQQKKIDQKEEKEEDGEELTPQARKLIEAEIAKAVGPLNDEIAFRDYFSEHPEDKKYQKSARARFDAWGNVPIEEVMKTLRTAIDPKEQEKAIERAQRGSIKGNTVRKGEEKVATTQKEFEEVYRNVKRGDTGSALKALGITK